ncbi:MAG: hypothetical protein U1F68_09010 [Gammaproteobacteria bacterium]
MRQYRTPVKIINYNNRYLAWCALAGRVFLRQALPWHVPWRIFAFHRGAAGFRQHSPRLTVRVTGGAASTFGYGVIFFAAVAARFPKEHRHVPVISFVDPGWRYQFPMISAAGAHNEMLLLGWARRHEIH